MLNKAHRSKAAGFTMLEMVTAMCIFAIMTAVGVINYGPLRDSFRRNTVRQNHDFDIHRTRNEALKNGARAIFTVDSGGASYSVGLDYFPFSSNGAIDTSLFSRKLPDNFTISTSQAIVFDSRGFLIDTSGVLTNTTLALSDHGTQYLGGTVYPTSYILFR